MKWNDRTPNLPRPSENAITVTPEFGPDGYLHAAPFTARPVADLDQINRWMAAHLRQRFDASTTLVTPGGVI